MPLSTRPERKPKIVIDTNILVSAGIGKQGHSSRIVAQIAEGKAQNFTSVEILLEIRNVFSRKEIKEKIPENDRNFLLAVYEQKSIIVKPSRQTQPISEDPDDDKFFRCALAANADFIVSGDPHVLCVKQFRKIRVLPPKGFLNAIQETRHSTFES